MQAALEKKRQKTQELLAERERLAEERTTKALEEAEARHDASNRALYELFVVIHLCIFSQSMHVMFVSLLTNMIDSSKTNVQTMCEKTGQVAPPMPVITPAGTVSFLSMIINTIECRRANHTLQLIFSCSITPVLHRMTLLLGQPRPTLMVLSHLSPEVHSGKFL